MNSLKENFSSLLFEEGLKYVDKNPQENMRKLVHLLERVPTSAEYQDIIRQVSYYADEPDSNWYRFAVKILSDLHPNVKKTLIPNFLIQATLLGRPRQIQNAKKYECNIPWAILMDPTSACNLKCVGCWAGEYSKADSLSLEELDRIICQGKKLGIRMYLYSGGEPLMRKKDLITLAEKHQDCAFLSFTNATLIDREFAKEVVRVGNLTFAISIEGFENETDLRRGKGTYQKVIEAMDILREEGAAFGYSCCYHSKNTPAIVSDEFVDYMINKGNLFAWYFTYIPIGKNSSVELIATPEQRKYMYHRIHEIRASKPLFALDFWNDGEHVEGCIAGGRSYLHINAHGDVEPCAFIHYSNLNIKDCTLLEALHSPLFQQYSINQPFNKNHLRPCPLLDNPQMLRAMVNRSGAHSTQPIDKESVEELTDKVQHTARAWAKVADPLWDETRKKKQNNTQKNIG